MKPPASSVDILSVVDEGLGHSSYVVALGDATALVVDPARLPMRQRHMATERGWHIAWTADTHSHADYISGSPELAADGAVFLAPARAALAQAHRGVQPGEDIVLSGDVHLRAIGTPGHTPEHLAYLLLDDGDPLALFSGGSLMVGTVGRTDLLSDRDPEDLARQLYRSLREEVLVLPDDLPVYPTHGAGSFCSAPTTLERVTTIGRERATNPLLQVEGEREFVHLLLASLGSFPPYFRKLPERNRRGVRHHAEIPTLPRLTSKEVADHLRTGAALIDARPIADVAAGHATGALSNALRPAFASWLGWLVDVDTPLAFVLAEDQDRSELVRQCLTVGFDALIGELDGGVEAWADAGHAISTTGLVDPASMAAMVLDVRQAAEYEAGHVPGAVNIELGALSRTDLAKRAVTLMCGHGERAMTGATLLSARGHHDVTVLGGGPGDWVARTGGQLVTGPSPQ
jgi:glyoxylase-like metal-dependent hydrolase (beta-lactamase superfamily II)/rhodanese-related sulfurtransferase